MNEYTMAHRQQVLNGLRKALGGFAQEEADRLLKPCQTLSLDYLEALLDAVKSGDVNGATIDTVTEAIELMDAGLIVDAFAELGHASETICARLQNEMYRAYKACGDTEEMRHLADGELKSLGIEASALLWFQDLPQEDAFITLDWRDQIEVFDNENDALENEFGTPEIAKALREALGNAEVA